MSNTISEKLTTIAENIPKVYEAGKEAALTESDFYNEFWDAYQESGTKKSYDYAFAGSGWNDTTFKPKYDISPTISTSHMFSASNIGNVKECLEKAGVKLDLSKMPSTLYIAQNSNITVLPILDLSNMRDLSYLFFGNSLLNTIEKIILKTDGTQIFSDNYSFGSLPALQNITFEGCIGNNINFKSSTQLSRESIESIIGHLSDTATGKTATFSLTAVNNAFSTEEWETLVATKTNWTVTTI